MTETEAREIVAKYEALVREAARKVLGYGEPPERVHLSFEGGDPVLLETVAGLSYGEFDMGTEATAISAEKLASILTAVGSSTGAGG